MKNVILTSTLLLITSFLWAQYPPAILGESFKANNPAGEFSFFHDTDGFYYSLTNQEQTYFLLKTNKDMEVVKRTSMPMHPKEEKLHSVIETTAGKFAIIIPTKKILRKTANMTYSHVAIKNGRPKTKKKFFEYNIVPPRLIQRVDPKEIRPASTIYHEFFTSEDKSKVVHIAATALTPNSATTHIQLAVFDEHLNKLYKKMIQLEHGFSLEVIEKITISNDGKKIYLLARAQEVSKYNIRLLKEMNMKKFEFSLYTVTAQSVKVTPIILTEDHIIHAMDIFYDNENKELAMAGLYGAPIHSSPDGSFFTTKKDLQKRTIQKHPFSGYDATIMLNKQDYLDLRKYSKPTTPCIRVYRIAKFFKIKDVGYRLLAQYNLASTILPIKQEGVRVSPGPIAVTSFTETGALVHQTAIERNNSLFFHKEHLKMQIKDQTVYAIFSSRPNTRDQQKYGISKGFNKFVTKLLIITPDGQVKTYPLFDNKGKLKRAVASLIMHVGDKNLVIGTTLWCNVQERQKKCFTHFLSFSLDNLTVTSPHSNLKE